MRFCEAMLAYCKWTLETNAIVNIDKNIFYKHIDLNMSSAKLCPFCNLFSSQSDDKYMMEGMNHKAKHKNLYGMNMNVASGYLQRWMRIGLHGGHKKKSIFSHVYTLGITASMVTNVEYFMPSNDTW